MEMGRRQRGARETGRRERGERKKGRKEGCREHLEMGRKEWLTWR